MSYWRKGHYSYSKLWCYIKDPQEYYRNYVLKMKDAPSGPMVLGRMFSEICEFGCVLQHILCCIT